MSEPLKILVTGDAVRAARVQKGLTQAELAAQVGTTQAYIHQLESRGAQPLPDEMARRLAQVLALGADALEVAYNGVLQAVQTFYELARGLPPVTTTLPARGRPRMTPEEKAQRRLESATIYKRLKGIRARNGWRDYERPRIADMQQQLKRILANAPHQYQQALIELDKSLPDTMPNCRAFLEQSKHGLLDDTSEFVTLPLEPEV